jgi:6-phosphofructokinase 1
VVIAQGGGPTAVINASLSGIVVAMIEGIRESGAIWGAQGGIVGVLEEKWIDLTDASERTWRLISHSAGSALGSCRKRLTEEEAEFAVGVLRKHDVRYFFYTGGNDSMDTALRIGDAAVALGYELRVAGVPKTIDNDLAETDHCPGYGSAGRYYAQSLIDLGADVRSLPTPVSIMEVMGRNTGWLTAAAMLGRKETDDAPHLLYVPEVPLSISKFLEDVKEVYSRQGWVVVAVSEGLKAESGEPLGVQKEGVARDGFGHPLQGEVAAALAGLVTGNLGIRARCEKPGLCGRASSLLVSSVDRREAWKVGQWAAQQALDGHSHFMAAIQREEVPGYRASFESVPLAKVANVERTLPLEYLTPDRNDIKEEFREYAEPLIGGPLHYHHRFF